MTARTNDDGRATAESVARWLPQQRSDGPARQFGAADLGEGPARPIPNEYFGAGRVSGARVEHNLPLVDSALYERGKAILTEALGWALANEESDEHHAHCWEAYAIPEGAAMRGYAYGHAQGAEEGAKESAREVVRLRERVAHLELENYQLASDPLHPLARAHVEKLMALIRKQDVEIDRLRAALASGWRARLLAMWGALWVR